MPAAPAGSGCLRRWHLARDMERLSGAQPKGGGEEAPGKQPLGTPKQALTRAVWKPLGRASTPSWLL